MEQTIMEQKSDKIAIVGLGYVGLPLAIAFGNKFPTIGYDINAKRVAELNNGYDHTLQSSKASIETAKFLYFSDQLNALKNCNIFIITVPTPVTASKEPDLSFLIEASKSIGAILKKGDIVIYESTVYPGCTEEECVPVLAASSGLVYNIDFYCGYSPERINPGDTTHTLTNIQKITAGSTMEVAEKIDQLYESIITAGTYKASSIKVAEAAKAIENAQRDINISFVNELALIFDKMNIDTNEVLEAAATKWNFLPFKPGLVGGHCIGVDPYYLAYKASKLGHIPEVILSGRNVNDQMGVFVAKKLLQLMKAVSIDLRAAKVLVLGLSFKENCPDIRNSKAFDILHFLQKEGIAVEAFDPFANSEEVKEKHAIHLITELGNYDGIIITVAHDFFKALDYKKLKRHQHSVIFDTKACLDKSIATARL